MGRRLLFHSCSSSSSSSSFLPVWCQTSDVHLGAPPVEAVAVAVAVAAPLLAEPDQVPDRGEAAPDHLQPEPAGVLLLLPLAVPAGSTLTLAAAQVRQAQAESLSRSRRRLPPQRGTRLQKYVP